MITNTTRWICCPTSQTLASPLSLCAVALRCFNLRVRSQLHGRTRKQRYSRLADWNYIGKWVPHTHFMHLADALAAVADRCAKASPIPLIGNGDVYNFEDVRFGLVHLPCCQLIRRLLQYYEHMESSPIATCMIARSARGLFTRRLLSR